jgi:hypothetical protein
MANSRGPLLEIKGPLFYLISVTQALLEDSLRAGGLGPQS